MLSNNRHPEAIELLKLNLNSNLINWKYLSRNPNAIELLKDNQKMIDWSYMSQNPSIFKLDYYQMMKNFEIYAEEIIAISLHPKRMIRYMEQYNFDFEDWFD